MVAVRKGADIQAREVICVGVLPQAHLDYLDAVVHSSLDGWQISHWADQFHCVLLLTGYIDHQAEPCGACCAWHAILE